jgi:hypothetical protein
MTAKRKPRIFSLLFIVLTSLGVSTQSQAKRLTPIEAKDPISEQATICGKVTSLRHAATARGKPIFLNLGKAYSSQIFTALIWGENREKFGSPEEKYRDKKVCVTGHITECRGAPEIVVNDPHSIEVQK